MDSESDSEDEPSPYDSPMAEEPDPAGSISAASAGGEGEAERDAASPAAEEEEEREDHDAAVSEPDSEADSLRAREDAEAAEWLGTPTKKEELWAAEKKEREAKYAQMEDDILKAFQRKKMERAVRAHERFESMLDDVMSGIDGVKKDAETPSGILREMDDMVDKRRAAYERKREEIHDEWQSDVFDRIQRQVKAHVDAIDPEELSDRLRAYHDEYYERDREKQEYNHRSGLFLDECLAYDYDAFEKNRAHAFQYTIDSLRDPTKRDVHKFVKEKLAAGLIKREAALAGTTPKYTLESKHWNNLKYTMHGRYVDEDGNALAPDAAIPGYFRQCDTETGEKMWNRHTADLTQYDAPTGNEFANAEWERWRGTQHVQMDYGPHGKLSLKGGSSWKDYRGGERMRELVEQRRPPGVTGGDYELEKKPHKTSMRDGAFYTLVPIRPRSRGGRRSLRTFPGASLRPGSLAFNPRPRCLSTPTDAYELHPDIRLYRTRHSGAGGPREPVRGNADAFAAAARARERPAVGLEGRRVAAVRRRQRVARADPAAVRSSAKFRLAAGVHLGAAADVLQALAPVRAVRRSVAGSEGKRPGARAAAVHVRGSERHVQDADALARVRFARDAADGTDARAKGVGGWRARGGRVREPATELHLGRRRWADEEGQRPRVRVRAQPALAIASRREFGFDRHSVTFYSFSDQPPPFAFSFSFCFFSSSFFFFRNSALHVSQYHFPLCVASLLSPTHAKWNHSIAQSSFSHAIISPNDTLLHTQYVGSFGSTGAPSP